MFTCTVSSINYYFSLLTAKHNSLALILSFYISHYKLFDCLMIQVPEDIRPFTESNTLVYHKFFNTDAVADELEVNVF